MKNINNPEISAQLIYDGDTQEIMNSVYSKKDFFRMTSIMSGVKYGIKTEEFINAVKDAYENGSTYKLDLFKLSVHDVAAGALDVLGIKKYEGDSIVVKQLIDAKFNV